MTMFGNAIGLNLGNLGMRLFEPEVAGAPPANLWYNPLGSAAITARIAAGGLWAWRAQANDNVTWGPGPADYAASLIDEAQGLVLVEGAGAVPWAALTGWGFLAAALQYFDTTLHTRNTWITFVQYTGIVQGGRILGVFDNNPGGHNFVISPRPGGPNHLYRNGGLVQNAPQVLAGNMAIVGQNGYVNGTFDIVIPGGNVGPSIQSLFVGARSTGGGADLFITANIQAVLVCDDMTAFAPADIAAIAALPAGSMHNL